MLAFRPPNLLLSVLEERPITPAQFVLIAHTNQHPKWLTPLLNDRPSQ
jgi:hypothetical protein